MLRKNKLVSNYNLHAFDSAYEIINSQHSSEIEIGKRIIIGILGTYRGKVAFKLWNGEQVIGHPNTECCVVIHEAGVLRELILYRSLSRLAEAYLEGEVSVEGRIETLFELENHLQTQGVSWRKKLHLITLALQLPPRRNRKLKSNRKHARTTHKNSRESIRHHYDVGNAFYRLWLDPEMVYSCAYFRDERQSLAQAQRDKLDYLCRKLRLQSGQYLLDIGCGWGALAIHAAKKYGVHVYGITLSQEQQIYAQERIQAEGLERQVRIDLLDYRELPRQEKYDRVISVGMFEHVGIKNYPIYFGIVKQILKPGGLFLNHGITSETGWRRTPFTRFINRYIFPDGELARISDVAHAMEDCGFEILDVEGLRCHYVYTLRHWIQALEENKDQAIQCSSAETYHLWRLYMSGSAYYFNEGSIGVYQLLVGHRHDPLPVPLRRDDLYR